MMSLVRKIAYPISVLYGVITSLRNKMFDSGILKSTEFDIPVIVVGNLSVGGTGKTPQIEYLIRLLKKDYKIAVLSRGYKRKSKGFFIADETSDAAQIGDEPFQYYQKFNDIIVAVDADRVNGINQLKQLKNAPEIILLDDAFQHRKLKAGFNILLTSYNDFYIDDVMLPTGNLRENRKGAIRAQVIVVTKCPSNLSDEEQQKIALKLNPNSNQKVFFSTIDYSDVVKNKSEEIALNTLKDYKVLLVTGIANSKPLEEYLKSKGIKFQHLKFADHHHFSDKDIDRIKSDFNKISSKKELILTTEKDYVRLNIDLKIFYLEIKTKLLNNEQEFDKKLIAYVEQSSRNS